MTEQAGVVLTQLRRQIEMLESDLRKLRTAEEVLLSLEAASEPLPRVKPKKLVQAVALALKEIGPAGSADVIQWLIANWKADVNPSSVRSTLSGYKGKLFDNDGRKWWVIDT